MKSRASRIIGRSGISVTIASTRSFRDESSNASRKFVTEGIEIGGPVVMVVSRLRRGGWRLRALHVPQVAHSGGQPRQRARGDVGVGGGFCGSAFMRARMASTVASSSSTAASRRAGTGRNLRSVLHRLAATCPEPARAIELYYWSVEPQLITLLRRIIALPDEPREALRAFLTVTADCPETVCVVVNDEGNVTLRSPAVAEAMLKTGPAPVKGRQPDAVH